MTLSEVLRPVSRMMAMVFIVGLIASGFTLLPPIAVTELSRQALDGRLTARTAMLWLGAIALGFAVSHILVHGATGYAQPSSRPVVCAP